MINPMKKTKKELVQIVDSVEKENRLLKDQLEAMQIVNSKIAEKKHRLHQVTCDLEEAIVENNRLIKKKEFLYVENKKNRQKAEMFEALFTSEKRMFLLVDGNLDILFRSRYLIKIMQGKGIQLQQNGSCGAKSLMDMVSGIERKIFYQTVQTALEKKTPETIKKIYLKLSPLVFIKVLMEMVPVTYNGKPGLKVLFGY